MLSTNPLFYDDIIVVPVTSLADAHGRLDFWKPPHSLLVGSRAEMKPVLTRAQLISDTWTRRFVRFDSFWTTTIFVIGSDTDSQEERSQVVLQTPLSCLTQISQSVPLLMYSKQVFQNQILRLIRYQHLFPLGLEASVFYVFLIHVVLYA